MARPFRCFIWVGVALLGLAMSAEGQSRKTKHTLSLDDAAKRPQARIADMAWLAGSWTGEAFGGSVEEVWTPPSAGTMVGLFKLSHKDKPSMYELELLVEEEGSLTLKVKHFNADFSAWEDKAGFVPFRLVKLGEETAWFDGLTIERRGPNRLRLTLAMKRGDELAEEVLDYTRR